MHCCCPEMWQSLTLATMHKYAHLLSARHSYRSAAAHPSILPQHLLLYAVQVRALLLRQDVAEANTAARLSNSHAELLGALEPLHAADGVVPPGFPETVAAVHSLPLPSMQLLLDSYGLSTEGSQRDKALRLLRFFGRP